MGNCVCSCSSSHRKKNARRTCKDPTDFTTDANNVDSQHNHGPDCRTPPTTTWEAVSRFFGPPPEPQNPLDGESFISISVRSDMDLGSAPQAPEHSASSFAGCVPQILPTTSRPAPLAALPSRKVHKLKPGGSSLVRVPPGEDHSKDYSKLPPFSYDTVDGSVFKLRTKGYLKTREKLPSQGTIYELAQADLYSTQNKHWHIVRRLQLPDVPDTATLPNGTSLDAAGYPPLLILHILMPTYPAQFFFPQTDGANCSFVYYFRLPEGFDPEKHGSPEALNLLRQLAASTGEPDDNTGIRSQVKMIAQVANPQEWHETGKLSKTELKLLQQYNAKPVLMRPVMRFYRGKNYLEIDFDLHNFTYVARKGLEGYISRLQPVVWDHGFCIEGRSDDELPEPKVYNSTTQHCRGNVPHIRYLAVLLYSLCANDGVRGYFWDFNKVDPFPVPSLLKNLPEDGSEMVDPEDPASDNAEVRAALATGNISLEAVPAPTTATSEEASADLLDPSNDGAGGAHKAMSPRSPTGSPLHTETVAVAPHAIQRTWGHGRERNPFAATAMHSTDTGTPHTRTDHPGNDSFMTAHSSLDHAGSLGSVGSQSLSASINGGDFRDNSFDKVAGQGPDFLPQASPAHGHMDHMMPASPSAIVRGVGVNMSGDSEGILLPCPP